ncbi:MAG: peptidylprolyl isomerase [Hyphomonas sp.]|uniref:peptidylprolyl isomerase n=1 Tax=Hyphomonas sp. TaxID=87 RepID=UPI0017B75F59|nr:peptidylprolyl isomerase [Hyphomonas sp.]MBA3070026.1 peptidylprolyl isomerase [Hyphomonas sp.]MBU3920651.1 peptidylprolyl isomerase [Alphaproteobacteria bacterium]MBU4060398.1 peptidylprolyl isomerase [Alphaproteobacteria bacterium]MBU4163066.1 peptidylprolyl isomerase [Alphaproteobacteria bacterium]
MVRAVLMAALVAMSAPVAMAQAAEENRLQLEGIAAIVNDKPISYSDVRQRARLLMLTLGRQQPSAEQLQQITGQALEQLIDERLQLDRVAEFEVEVDRRDIDAEMSDMAAEGGIGADGLRQQLLAAGVNPLSLEEQIRADIAWNRLMSGLYGSRIRVSESQVEDQLERLRTASKKTQFRVSEIFLYAPDAETRAEALKAAGSIVQQLQQGADFRVAAQRISSAPTAATGGDMGWVTAEDLPPALSSAVAESTAPALLPPIETESGIYILSVVAKREPSQPTTRVDLKRLIATDGQEATILEAMTRIKSCNDVQSVANSKTELRAQDLPDIDVEELGPEGRTLVLATDVGSPTEVFAVGSGLAVMYVCSREDGAEALPSKEDLKNSIKSRELSMISDRELRNSRRDATIIYR